MHWIDVVILVLIVANFCTIIYGIVRYFCEREP